MLLTLFGHSEPQNLFNEKFFVFKEGVNLENIARLGQKFPPKKEEVKKKPTAEKKKPPVEKKKKADILPPPAKKSDDKEVKKAAPRKTTSQALDRTRKRVQRELFGREKLGPYIDKIKEAIEKMGPDKLREFIQSHNSYSGDFRTWNKDLFELFSVELKKGQLARREHARFAAALQIFLADHFKSKGDVFQAKRGKKANPFIYIDGKLGGYTISVLAAYWNSKYPEKKKKSGELAYADLSADFRNRKRSKKAFDAAIVHLKSKLGGKATTEVLAAKDKSKLDSKNLEELRKQLRKNKKQNEAYLAAAREFMKKNKIQDEVGKPWPDGKLDKFRKDYFGKLNNEEYIKVAKGAGVTVKDKSGKSGGGDALSDTQDTSIPSDVPPEKPKPEVLVSFEDLPQNIQDGINGFLDASINIENHKRILVERKKKCREDVLDFLKEGHRGPSAWHIYIDMTSDANTRVGSWPRLAYGKYETAFDNWQKANRNYNIRIKNNQIYTETQKEEKLKKIQDFEEKRDEAVENMRIAIDEYYAQGLNKYELAKVEFRLKLAQEAGKYDFPENFNFQRKYKDQEKELRKNIPRGLIGPRYGSDKFLKKYFTQIPTRVFKSIDDLRESKLIKEGKLENLGARLQYHKVDLYEIINSLIYLNNLRQFNNTEKAMFFGSPRKMPEYLARLDEFRKKIDSVPLDTMLANVKKRTATMVASAATK